MDKTICHFSYESKTIIQKIMSNNHFTTEYSISAEYQGIIYNGFGEDNSNGYNIKNSIIPTNTYTISVEKGSTGFINKVIIKDN